jgi:hypothetical protein
VITGGEQREDGHGKLESRASRCHHSPEHLARTSSPLTRSVPFFRSDTPCHCTWHACTVRLLSIPVIRLTSPLQAIAIRFQLNTAPEYRSTRWTCWDWTREGQRCRVRTNGCPTRFPQRQNAKARGQRADRPADSSHRYLAVLMRPPVVLAEVEVESNGQTMGILLP